MHNATIHFPFAATFASSIFGYVKHGTKEGIKRLCTFRLLLIFFSLCSSVSLFVAFVLLCVAPAGNIRVSFNTPSKRIAFMHWWWRWLALLHVALDLNALSVAYFLYARLVHYSSVRIFAQSPILWTRLIGFRIFGSSPFSTYSTFHR